MAQLLHLALSGLSLRWKCHESVIDCAMNIVMGRGVRNGSVAPGKRESHEDPLTPVRLPRANSLRIA
jgi:hypothetical protein